MTRKTSLELELSEEAKISIHDFFQATLNIKQTCNYLEKQWGIRSGTYAMVTYIKRVYPSLYSQWELKQKSKGQVTEAKKHSYERKEKAELEAWIEKSPDTPSVIKTYWDDEEGIVHVKGEYPEDRLTKKKKLQTFEK